jgi:hypothetical protein
MTSLTQPAPHTTTPNRAPRAHRAGHATAREARRRRSFEGVFASYIRELAADADASPASRRPAAG